MLRRSLRRFFYVVTSRMEDDPHAWRWEIRRKRKPLGVRLWEGNFRSSHEAQLAGKQALEDFLNGLSSDRLSADHDVPIVMEGLRRKTERRATHHARSSTLERGFLESGHRKYVAEKRYSVTFIVHASKNEDVATTIRLRGAAAVAKATALADQGWQVFITGPDGNRYYLSEFEQLLSPSSAF